MRLAALYDIHSNLPALEAVLEEIHRAGVDQILVGGDVVPGPMPRETLACLRRLDLPAQYIRGNGDRAVLELLQGETPSDVPESFLPALRWVAAQLGPEEERLLAGWPATLRLDLAGLGEALFCHATPRSDTEIFTRLTSEERLRSRFEGLEAALVVCGHTHMQFDRRIGNVRVVNAGSVGMPFGAPGAYWLLLDPEPRLQHTPYDFAAAANRVRSTGYPLAEDFAARQVLRPPAETEMLALFTRQELS